MHVIPLICRRLARDTRGATAIEYGLIAALIVLGLMTGLSKLGGGANGMWGKVGNDVSNSM